MSDYQSAIVDQEHDDGTKNFCKNLEQHILSSRDVVQEIHEIIPRTAPQRTFSANFLIFCTSELVRPPGTLWVLRNPSGASGNPSYRFLGVSDDLCRRYDDFLIGVGMNSQILENNANLRK